MDTLLLTIFSFLFIQEGDHSFSYWVYRPTSPRFVFLTSLLPTPLPVPSTEDLAGVLFFFLYFSRLLLYSPLLPQPEMVYRDRFVPPPYRLPPSSNFRGTLLFSVRPLLTLPTGLFFSPPVFTLPSAKSRM